MTPHHARLRLLLLYAALALPLVVWGASRALQANNNSPIDWVTADFPPRAEYDAHCELFGPGDTVMMSWPACSIHDPSLDRLLEVLRTARGFYDDREWLLHSATSGRDAVRRLMQPTRSGEGPAMGLQDAVARLRNRLVGPDGATTAVVVTFTKEGLKQRERLVALMRQAAHEVCGVPDEQLRLAGPVIDGLSVDTASQQTLARYAAPSAAVVLILCALNLRSLRAAIVVFGLSMLCQGATLALVYYSGQSMSALLIVLPPLIQVLAVAGGVHLTNYYFDLDPRAPHSSRIAQAIRNGWLPCVLSAGTTALGMASLMASRLQPIREFGAYSSAGVLITVGVLLGVLPACYLIWPPRAARDTPDDNDDSQPHAGTPAWAAWANSLARLNRFAVEGGIVLVLVGAWFASSLTTSVRIETMFASEHRVIADYRWLEEKIGPLVPLEVTLAFDPSSPVSHRERLGLLRRIGDQLERQDALSSCWSAANCLPRLPDLSQLSPEQQDQLIEPLIAAQQRAFEQLGLLKVVGGVEHWRLTTQTSALGSADYGRVLGRVQQVVDDQLNASPPAMRQGLSTNTTGIMPLVHAIQGQLLDDLLISFVAALALITVVMTLVQAGVAAGLLAMIPNVFPLAVFFGFLGWRGAPIDIGVVMTASVALGIAVDDTLHFLTFFQRGLARFHQRQPAVAYALTHCGPAMIQTSVSCGLGLLVFALSDFLPTSRFATSMAVLLALALAGDLILLPALLLSPLGRLCQQPAASAHEQSPTATPSHELPQAA